MMDGKLPVYLVDAFATKPFEGNPAAVVLVNDQLQAEGDATLAAIGKEMNQAETAFIRRLSPEDTFETSNRFGLRWFTPAVEVPLCGHATVASAAVLFYESANPNNELVFESLSGELKARRSGDVITLDFPVNPPQIQDKQAVDAILQEILKNVKVGLEEVEFSATTGKLVVRLPDTFTRFDLESLVLDVNALHSALPDGMVKGVIITVKADSDSGYDFFSRYFAPWVGIPEDSVTGSAHTVLTPFWSKRLGKKSMKARQCSARGGDVLVQLRDDDRVEISGAARVVMSGYLRV